jgi:ribonuclease R
MTIPAEDVLGVLARRGRGGLTLKALQRELRRGRHELPALRRTLQRLMQQGRVERLHGRYRPRREDGLVEATYHGAPGRAGQALDDAGRAFAVAEAEAGGASDGDRVLLRPDAEAQRGASVVHVLGGARREWVGILARERGAGVVTPYRDDGHWSLHVAAEDLAEARDGDVVVAVPTRRRGPAGAASARVAEVLGPPGTPDADFRAVVWHRRLPVAFPEAALADVAAQAEELDPAEVTRRVDLRARPFVTIDPATARDHDDAVCVEPAAQGATRLWVAIADVSHYVPEGSALDAEALRRGTSVYFPDRAIPMLPERLSGDLCSLRPQRDRHAMCVELLLSAEAEVLRRSFYPAVIRSHARLAYPEAAEVMAGRDAGRPLPAPVAEQLLRLADLARRLTERRFAAGSIDFDLPSAEIVLGDDGHPTEIVQAPRTLAHRAIEEAMLAANRAVAEALGAARVPALYRVHEPPAPADVETLEILLESFGLLERRRGGRALEPHDVARAIQRVSGRPEERLVNLVALRSMRQARYASQDLGHFALAFSSYTHFTSPIRRYADLVVHRALKDLLADDPAARRRAEARGRGLDDVAARVSLRERVAEAAEREMVDLKKAAFMVRHIGEEYDGTITGVARHGLYVTPDAFFVEGLVHVSRLAGYAVLDERAHALVVRGTRERFRLGDRVRVRVDAVDRVKAWINFSLLARLRGGAVRASSA